MYLHFSVIFVCVKLIFSTNKNLIYSQTAEHHQSQHSRRQTRHHPGQLLVIRLHQTRGLHPDQCRKPPAVAGERPATVQVHFFPEQNDPRAPSDSDDERDAFRHERRRGVSGNGEGTEEEGRGSRRRRAKERFSQVLGEGRLQDGENRENTENSQGRVDRERFEGEEFCGYTGKNDCMV